MGRRQHTVLGTLPIVTAIRVVIGVIVGAISLVALVPMIVVVDLAGGGDGLGLCEGGLTSCRTSYFDGPELLGLLVIVLFLLVMLLRAAMNVRGVIEARRPVRLGERPRE